MRIRNWLMTGTSLGLLTLAPIPVFAQDAPTPELPQQCIDAGITDFDACIAAQSAAPAPEEPAAEPEAAPAPEAAPEPAPEPAPEAAPAEEPAPPVEPEPEAAPVEAPPPEPAAAPEPAPEPEPEVQQQVQEAPAEVAPEPEAPAAETAPQEEAAPAVEAPAEPQAAPEAVQEQAPEQAPEPAPEAAPDAPPPAETAPAEQQQPAADIGGALQTQVDLYNSAIADMMSGGDAAAAQAQIAAAQNEISALCTNAGAGDITTCLATYGLELPAVPGLPEAQQPAAETPADAGTPPADTSGQAVDAAGQPVEVLEALPEGITQEQVAPMLDSAKEAPVAPVEGQPAPEAVPAEDAGPPPENDAAAQARFAPAESARVSATEEQGETVTAAAVAPQQVPQNVTIVNQTNVTNNITNNTQNNTVDNSQTNIGQQTNIEQNDLRQTTYGDQLTQVILQIGTQLIVNTPGQDTDRYFDNQQDEVFYENLSNGRVRETITRPDGTEIVTVRNRNGDVLRRSRFSPDGRETVLAYFDDRYDNDLLEWRDPGQDLPPLRLNIPAQDYVLDADTADQQDVERFFSQPPVEQVARLYSIDEVKRSARVRDSVRKLEVGGLTFDSGAATISRDQVGALSKVADAMLGLLETNPGETFLIEGHTDAVGTDIKNLQLSDLRAATVARILTDFYHVPPENLATQGYGERYLRIRTDAAERENRRVTIRRITPLITLASN